VDKPHSNEEKKTTKKNKESMNMKNRDVPTCSSKRKRQATSTDRQTDIHHHRSRPIKTYASAIGNCLRKNPMKTKKEKKDNRDTESERTTSDV
jgi:hypothetical protein